MHNQIYNPHALSQHLTTDSTDSSSFALPLLLTSLPSFSSPHFLFPSLPLPSLSFPSLPSSFHPLISPAGLATEREHIEESRIGISIEERKEKNKGLWMIVATHLLSILAHAHTDALTLVDKTESEAEGKEKEDVEGEVDRLGPEQARSMLALLTGDNLILSHLISSHLISSQLISSHLISSHSCFLEDMLPLHLLPSSPPPLSSPPAEFRLFYLFSFYTWECYIHQHPRDRPFRTVSLTIHSINPM